MISIAIKTAQLYTLDRRRWRQSRYPNFDSLYLTTFNYNYASNTLKKENITIKHFPLLKTVFAFCIFRFFCLTTLPQF